MRVPSGSPEAKHICRVVTVAGHAHHLFDGGNLLLIESFRKSDRELQIQVALVEWVVLDGHALPIYALPAIRLDDLPWLRVDLRARPRTGMSAQYPAPSTSRLLTGKVPSGLWRLAGLVLVPTNLWCSFAGFACEISGQHGTNGSLSDCCTCSRPEKRWHH